MSKISIEGTPVTGGSSEGVSNLIGLTISGHLLLIYEDDAGNEFVVRGGPTPGANYGALIIQQNVPIDNSADRRVDNNDNPVTPASRGNRVIPLGNRKAEDVWNLILQQAKNINNQMFPYEPLGKNSNGTVGNLLNLVGINIDNVLPNPNFGMLIPFSGKNEEFSFDYTIIGTDSNDIIVGRGGNQTFYGGKGKDKLNGGLDDDNLFGGKDDDTFYVYSKGDVVTEYLNEGKDTINTYSDTIYDHFLIPDNHKNVELIQLIGFFGKVRKSTVVFSEGNGYFGATVVEQLGSENFLEANSEEGIEFYFDGGADNYYIDGSIFTGNNIFYAGNGNDEIRGGTGKSQFFGGAGEDRIFGTGSLYGGEGNDTLVADIGDNILYGGIDNDLLYSGAGNDTLFGEAGNDYFRGYTGYNTLYGGEGADTFELTPGGVQIISDFEKGIDKIEGKNVADPSHPYGGALGDFNSLSLQQNGNDVNVIDNFGKGELVAIIENTSVSGLSAKDFNLWNYHNFAFDVLRPETYISPESTYDFVSIFQEFYIGSLKELESLKEFDYYQNFQYQGDTIQLSDAGGYINAQGLSPLLPVAQTDNDYLINQNYTPFNVISPKSAYFELGNCNSVFFNGISSISPKFNGNDFSIIYDNLIEQTFVDVSGVLTYNPFEQYSQDFPISNALLSAPIAYITWTSPI